MKKYLKTLNHFFFFILALIILIPTSLYAQKLDKLIIKEKYENAEKYCSKQIGEYQKECYLKLANAYLMTKNDYGKAEMSYEKAGKQYEGYLKIGDVYFANNNYDKAAEYYEKAENKDGFKKIANMYLISGNYNKSVDFYIKAGEADKAVYNKVADDAFANNKYDNAAEYYEKAENKDGLKKIADIHFNNENYDKSADLYIKAGEADKAVYNKVADDAFANNKYDKAAEYYEKAENMIGQKLVADKVAYLKKLETINIGVYSGDGIKIKLTKDYKIQILDLTMYFDDNKGITEDSFKSVPIDESFNFSCYQKKVGHGNVTRAYHANVGAWGTTIHFSYAEQWDINIEGNIDEEFIIGKITIFENGRKIKTANWKAKYRN